MDGLPGCPLDDRAVFCTQPVRGSQQPPAPGGIVRIDLFPSVPDLRRVLLLGKAAKRLRREAVVRGWRTARPFEVAVAAMEVHPRHLEVRVVGDEGGAVACLAQGLRQGLVFVEEPVPAGQLVRTVLVEHAARSHAPTGQHRAPGGDCRHAVGIAVFEGDAVLGEPIEAGATHQAVASVRLEVVRSERVRDQEDQIAAVALAALVRRPFPGPAGTGNGSRAACQAARGARRGARSCGQESPARKPGWSGVGHRVSRLATLPAGRSGRSVGARAPAPVCRMRFRGGSGSPMPVCSAPPGQPLSWPDPFARRGAEPPGGAGEFIVGLLAARHGPSEAEHGRGGIVPEPNRWG